MTNVVYGGPYLVVSYDFQGPLVLMAVPEAVSLSLVGFGLGGLALLSRRRT